MQRCRIIIGKRHDFPQPKIRAPPMLFIKYLFDMSKLKRFDQ